MDIGREVRKTEANLYSLRLIYKDHKGIERLTREEVGKTYITNIDEKGRIYLPKKYEEGELFYSLKKIYGFVTLSVFGHLILFSRINAKEALDKVRKRPETKIAESPSRKSGNASYMTLCSNADPKLKSILSLAYIRSEWTAKWRPFPNLGIEKYYIKRSRMIMPRPIINFVGIDIKNLGREQILFYELKDETEIWEKNRWLDNMDKMNWSSKASMTKLFNNKISAKKHTFLSPFYELRFEKNRLRTMPKYNLDGIILL